MIVTVSTRLVCARRGKAPKSASAGLIQNLPYELFDRICDLPEYYLTRTERAIFEAHAVEIIGQAGSNLTLVELGAGSASKFKRKYQEGPNQTRVFIALGTKRNASKGYEL